MTTPDAAHNDAAHNDAAHNEAAHNEAAHNEAAAPKHARLNMRLTAEALATIKQAAAIQQQDLTSFVLGAALDRARGVLAEERILRLSPHDITALEAMLDREPQVIPQLAALISRYGNPAGASAERNDRSHA